MSASRTTGRALAYPTDHVLGVLDDPARVAAALEALAADGLPAEAVTVLEGADAEMAMGRLGRPRSLAQRLLRLVRFTTMDQQPDLQLYEAAVADGRAVVAVHVADSEARHQARAALERSGAHFLNFYGRFYTEELTRWRGPELDLPEYLRR
jgi:hypothetical protein